MKVRITFDLSLSSRKAIAHRYGRRGPAGRDLITEWITGTVNATLQDLEYELDTDEGRAR